MNDYAAKYHGLVDRVVGAEDATESSMAQCDLMTLSTEVRKEVEDIKGSVKSLKDAYAATPEGLLARKTRAVSEKIGSQEGLDIFKLPVKKIHEVIRHFQSFFSLNCKIDHGLALERTSRTLSATTPSARRTSTWRRKSS